MARITLINPNRMQPGVAPIALDYLAESLAVAGHDVCILDLCFVADWREAITAHFVAEQADDVVGFTIRNTDDCYFASQDFFIPRYAEMIGHLRGCTEAPVVLGGAGLSTAAKPILGFLGADYAIQGEGEVALPLLADRMSRGESPQDIPGLVYRVDTAIRANPSAWMDMAALPIRSRQWLDNRLYFTKGGQAGIETKRGCGGRCIYCADPIGKGRACRLRPPEHVVAELRALVEQGIDVFHLCDSEFNLPLRHAEELCREIIRVGLGEKICWYAYASPVPFNEEFAKLAVRAGCAGIDFGADSGDDGMLHALGRDFTADDLRSTAAICHRQGISFMYDLLIGGPGETYASVERTIALMKEIQPPRVGVSVGVRIYGSTQMAELVRREGYSPANTALHGRVADNADFTYPVFYIAPEVGLEVVDYIDGLVAGDSRFLHPKPDELEGNYNYNDNRMLVEAIEAGHRGAYWDILRQLDEA